MLVGGVLNANTVLQPQFTQQLLGYTATTAGMALTAGGFALVVMMPLAGFATGKYPARYLAAFGFTMLVITFRYAADVTNLQMSFSEASWLRVVQMLPLPFCFISITNAAYVGMPQKESNQVAGLINFVRNIGGSILIAITNAQVTSRAMWHEQHLQQAMLPGAPGYDQHVSALTGFFNGSAGTANGAGMAIAQVYNQLNDQARMQGYQDVYMQLSYASILLIVLAFMLSKSRPGEGPGGSAGVH
jgi:MFS transporter, DHA2 family, multidrug resistance protein